MKGRGVKVVVPKVRRNTGEVRPYNDLPGSAPRSSDAMLLWVTTAVLGGALLVLGGFMVYWNFEKNSQSAIVIGGAVGASETLAEARQHFIRGESREAVVQARVALALEQQQASDPPLEKDIRRVIALGAMEQRDYGVAVEELAWIQQHGPNGDDRKNFEAARSRLKKLNVDAVHELEGAQRLSTAGRQDRAYAQASHATNRLHKQSGDPATAQAGHLVMANIALRQGQYREALEQMRLARRIGPLGPGQEALLRDLEAYRPDQKRGLLTRQVPVVVPRLEGAANSYPHGRLGRPSMTVSSGKPSATEELPEEDLPESTGAVPPTRRGPRLELPKLQFPNGSNSSSSGVPGYQNNRPSGALPSYNTQTRPRDTLPGY